MLLPLLPTERMRRSNPMDGDGLTGKFMDSKNNEKLGDDWRIAKQRTKFCHGFNP